jgi:hypothetical protein
LLAIFPFLLTLDLLFIATFVLAIYVASCINNSTSFFGLLCAVLDVTGAVVLALPAVAPGLLPLASPDMEDNAATMDQLPAEPPELIALTPAPSRLATGLQ